MIELKEHNKAAYENIMESFGKGAGSVIYVSGVGTGKSFVFMAVAEKVKGDILYIVPKNAIVTNMNSYDQFSLFSGRVTFMTYQSFSSIEKGRALIAGHDLIVIDECHHLGSDLYGRVLVSLIKERSALFLGLTATPVRDADGFDVSSYFDARVDGITNFEAIERGLMPPIEYRVCLPEKDLRQVEKEYDGAVKAVLSYEDSEEILSDALCDFERDKWICFFPSVSVLEAHRALAERLFPGHRIFTLYSTLNNLDEVMTGLLTSKKAVVLSCNILLEGIHLPGIDGIILFRNVTSLTAFQQMIGRVCSIGKDIPPVVLDCSSCAVKLMARLLAANRGEGSFPKRTADGEEKEIIRISIGEHKDYNILQLFALAQGTKVTDKEVNAAQKYRAFSKKTYRTISEMKKDWTEYRKLLACCDLYGASIYGTFFFLNAA